MEHGSKLALAGLALIFMLLAVGTGAASAGTEGAIVSGRDAQTKDMVFWLHWDPTSPTVNGQATQWQAEPVEVKALR